MFAQVLGPTLEGGRLCRQGDVLAGGEAAVRRLDILQQDPPRDDVDHEMVGDQQPSCLPSGAEIETCRPEYRPLRQVQTRLQLGRGRFDGLRKLGLRHGRQVHLGDVRLAVRLGDDLAPLGAFTAEARAERVVVLQHLAHDSPHRGHVQRLTLFQQDGLVEMVRIGQRTLEKPPLNRGQGHGAGDGTLLGGGLLFGAGDGREPGDGWVLEDLRGRQRQAGLARLGDDLNADHRIPAQLEEVVVDADFLDSQRLSPDVGENPLGFVPRGDVVRLERRARVQGRRGRLSTFGRPGRFVPDPAIEPLLHVTGGNDPLPGRVARKGPAQGLGAFLGRHEKLGNSGRRFGRRHSPRVPVVPVDADPRHLPGTVLLGGKNVHRRVGAAVGGKTGRPQDR